jgi:ribosomal protein S18 acetylase RimI-like enzyme
VQVRPATRDDLRALLDSIAAYQRQFAGGAQTDAHNEGFFARFLDPSDAGLLLVAGGGAAAETAGYATLYWTFSSVSATEVVLLNDLWVAPAHRGSGVGEALVAAAAAVARDRGASHLRWFTTLDNRRAQKLYEGLGAARSAWFEYEIAI